MDSFWKKESLIKRLSLLFILLFVASFYLSTAGIYLNWGMMSLLTVISLLVFRKVPYSRKDMWLFLMAYPIGALLNLMSPSGVDGMLGFLEYDCQVLTLFILMVLNPSKKFFKVVVYVMLISAVIGSLFAFFLKLFPDYYVKIYDESLILLKYKVRSFRAVINWGEVLQFAVLINISVILWSKQIKRRLVFIVVLAILLTALGLSGSRSSVLAVIAGSFVIFFYFMSKRMIVVMSALLLIAISVVYVCKDQYWASRFYSFVDVKSDSSNVIRLRAWEVGLDIAKDKYLTGVGVSEIENTTDKYRENLTEDEKKEWDKLFTKSLSTFENSYINILVRSGIFYFLYFFGFMFYFIIRSGLRLRKLKGERSFAVGIFAILVGFCVSMVFFGLAEGSSSYLFFFMLFYMIKFTDKEELNRDCEQNGIIN
ncbi:MAG: O-antigen ligase family protein [Bacteroidales bacterium]|jgi:O-antigen ligase|nr:O-antigen ligase family protein [Bacteroidales bacterium]